MTFEASSHRKRWTLRKLTLFYVVLGVLLTALLDTAIYCTLSVKTLNAEIERRHALLSSNLANVIETAWRTENYPLMVQLVDSIRAQGDVEQAAVSDQDGRIIVSSDPAFTGKQVTDMPSFDRVVDVSSLGKLHLKLASDQTSAFLLGFLWRGLIATTIALALISLLAHRPQRSLVSAFEDTVNAAEKLSAGDFSLRLPEHPVEEFNRLHVSLNHAASQLQQLTSSLREEIEHANAANQAKDRFLANISHELRTPMNGVLGIAQLMETTQLPQEHRLHLETLRRCSESLLTVLNDLIDFARVDAGHETLRLSPCNVVHLLEDVMEMMAPQADSKGLEIAFFNTIPMRAWHFQVDAARLRQIFYTVFSFSISHTHDGRITVRLDADISRHPAALTLTLADTGHGMSDKELYKILDPFQQAGTYAFGGGDKGGLNLGLALSRRLAMLMQGDLKAESMVGHGTVFTLSLQAERALQDNPLESAEWRDKKVLLLAPPKNLSGQSVKQHLQLAGCDVTEASSIENMDHSRWRHVIVVDDGNQPKDVEQLAQAVKQAHCIMIRPRHLCVTAVQSGALASIQQLPRPVRVEQLLNALRGQKPTVAVDGPVIVPGDVLIVEDIETNRMVLKKLLERESWRVFIAEHGGQALELLDNGLRPRVILMDLQMPVMDGFEATFEIRSRERRGQLPHQLIYAVTASTSREDADRCLVAGMDALIPKPFRMAEFKALLSKQPAAASA